MLLVLHESLVTSVDGSEILHQLRLVVYPIIYRVLYIPGGWPWDFWTINSSVAWITANLGVATGRFPKHQQFTLSKFNSSLPAKLPNPNRKLHLPTTIFQGLTLPETNSSPLKMDGWKMNFLLGWPNFRGKLLVSGRVKNWGRKEYFPTDFPSLPGNCIRQKGMNHNSKPSRNGLPLDIQPEFHGLPWFDNKLQVRLLRKISEIPVFQKNPGCWNIIIWKDMVLKSIRGDQKTIPICQLFSFRSPSKIMQNQDLQKEELGIFGRVPEIYSNQ